MTSPKSRIGRIVNFTRVSLAASVKEALLRNWKPHSRFDFGLEMFNMSLEGEFKV